MGQIPESKEELLQFLESSLLKNIMTWSDFYSLLNSLFEASKNTPIAMLDLHFTMYSFLLAMKELPDEGDIIVLVRRALRILVMEGEDRFGITVSVPANYTPEVDKVEKRMETDLQSLSITKSVINRLLESSKKTDL